MRLAAALLLVSWPSLAPVPQEAPPPPVPIDIYSIDPWLSIQTGADLTTSLVARAGLGEDLLFRARGVPPASGGERTVPNGERASAGKRAGRLAWTLALDVPLGYWFALLQHEAFGHGGRVREFGGTASLHMGSPWNWERTSFAGFDPDEFTDDELLRIYAGGSEANSYAATLTERRMVAGRPMGVFDLVFLAWNRYATPAYVLRTTPDPEDDPAGFYGEWLGGGDVANYLGYLSRITTGSPGISPGGSSELVVDQFRRMERQAVWNLLDPGLWLALWQVGRRTWQVAGAAPVPVPTLDGRRFLPVLSAEWIPDATIVSLELVFQRSASWATTPTSPGPGDYPGWLAFIARRGRGPAGSHTALGVESDRWALSERWRWSGGAEAWRRPDGGIGGGARLGLQRRSGPATGLSFEVGVKSAGHWPGRPAATGPFVRFGWVIPG